MSTRDGNQGPWLTHSSEPLYDPMSHLSPSHEVNLALRPIQIGISQQISFYIYHGSELLVPYVCSINQHLII